MHKTLVTFSIITVCYNSDKTIERTIQSILKQTYEQFEYIIIDGKSQDNTLKIIMQYAAYDKRIKWLSEPDKGIYDAMNKGIINSNGIIIGIVNSDDWLEANALDLVYQSYKTHNQTSGIYTGSMYFHSIYDTIILKTSAQRFKSLIAKNLMPIRHPATFVTKDIYNKIGLFDLSYKIFSDKDFIYRCIENKVKFFFIEQPLSNMSDGGISNSTQGIKKGFQDELLFYNRHNKNNQYLYAIRYFITEIIKFILPRFFLNKLRR